MVAITNRNKSKTNRSFGRRKKAWFGQKNFRQDFIDFHNLKIFKIQNFEHE